MLDLRTKRLAGKLTKSLLLAATLLPFAPFGPARAFAAPLIQSLNRTRSVVRFDVDSPVLQVGGRIPEIAGSVELDPATQQLRSVEFRVNLSSVELDAQDGGLAMLSPEALFRSMPNPIASFRSTDITRINEHNYRVRGRISHGGNSWDLNVPVSRLAQSQDEATYVVKLSGPLNLQQLSLPVPRGAGRGSLDGRLVFQRAARAR